MCVRMWRRLPINSWDFPLRRNDDDDDEGGPSRPDRWARNRKICFFFVFFLNFALWHMGKEKCIVSVNSLYGYLSALYWTRLKELRGNWACKQYKQLSHSSSNPTTRCLSNIKRMEKMKKKNRYKAQYVANEANCYIIQRNSSSFLNGTKQKQSPSSENNPWHSTFPNQNPFFFQRLSRGGANTAGKLL